MTHYQAEIESTVAGILCIIGVIDWEAYVPAYTSGPPDRCYPSEGGCGSWEVLDRRGRKAPWLERKLNRDECRRIDTEVAEYFQDLRDQARIDAWEDSRYN